MENGPNNIPRALGSQEVSFIAINKWSLRGFQTSSHAAHVAMHGAM